VATKDWETLTGIKHIKFYESSLGEHKGFCSECGSSLFAKFDNNPDVLSFALGSRPCITKNTINNRKMSEK
jgi:hypothetical protein